MPYTRRVDQLTVEAWVQELPVRVKGPVHQGQWEFAVTVRQVQHFLLRIGDEVEARQPVPHRGTDEVHAVVVIPEGGSSLLQRVLIGARANGGLAAVPVAG